ncbi:LacI family DNA-binding transcriptional regulator [Tamlana sp. I1]|uniref:LacI family DNA-binding transcriptional regulator n=1 Tax=Tamlana sp. I1 TaxID=2762061 RepID=UPI00188E095E|nr:LacI family DNA-binding transcriptional regulator [Tamlana sp. I1]
MKRKITLKQIAKELGVSIGTVSKALKDSKEISEETKEKIQAFAKYYNYKPNNIALSLKNRKTKTIGILIPEIVHHFFSKVIQGIEKVANKKGYNVIIGLSNESFDKEVINMEMLASGSIDGFIMSISKETLLQQDYHHLNETINQGMPIVMFDRVVSDIRCDKVIINDVEAAKKAVNKLIKNNCKKIAIITTKDYVNVGRLRTQGYVEALNDHEIAPEPELILKVDDKLVTEDYIDVLEEEIKSLFLINPDIDGVFAVNELYAITTMKVAKNLGRKIPEDLQVIGFTDGVLSRHASPSLTTVTQYGQKIGEVAAALLIEKIESEASEDPVRTVVIETELIERESTK